MRWSIKRHPTTRAADAWSHGQAASLQLPTQSQWRGFCRAEHADRPSWWAALAVALISASNAGCQSDESDATGSIAIVISGDTAGWIVPCGCASNQSGGLLRRGSYLDSLRQENEVLVLDAGGAAAGASPYDQAKFEAIVRGELQMGLKAHNLGASEAKFGERYLRDVAHSLNIPFVSCNVRNAKGDLLVRPMVHIEMAERRFAVIGVLSPQFQVESLQITPPLAAILETLAASSASYDHLIVLAYLPDDELRELAQQLPEADLIVGGPTGQSIAPERTGPTWIAAATNKGKFLVEMRAPRGSDANQWEGRVLEMSDRYVDDPTQQQNLEQYYAALRRHDFTPQETEFSKLLPGLSPTGNRVAGNASCSRCHAGDHQAWEHSGHAHAWNSLQSTGAHVDPYCQQCHTTAYGWTDGFQSVRRTPALVNVGCETCHGSSQDHADDPQIPTAHFQQASQQCVVCHDRENSPHFAYDAYWSQIRHGLEDALPPRAADEPSRQKESG